MIPRVCLAALFVVALFLVIATGQGAGESMTVPTETVTCDEVKSLAASAALQGQSMDGYTDLMRLYC